MTDLTDINPIEIHIPRDHLHGWVMLADGRIIQDVVRISLDYVANGDFPVVRLDILAPGGVVISGEPLADAHVVRHRPPRRPAQRLRKRVAA